MCLDFCLSHKYKIENIKENKKTYVSSSEDENIDLYLCDDDIDDDIVGKETEDLETSFIFDETIEDEVRYRYTT